MKHVKMTITLTALCARNMQQKDGLFEFFPKHIFGNSSGLQWTPTDEFSTPLKG